VKTRGKVCPKISFDGKNLLENPIIFPIEGIPKVK
jgi:hypothetical protein